MDFCDDVSSLPFANLVFREDFEGYWSVNCCRVKLASKFRVFFSRVWNVISVSSVYQITRESLILAGRSVDLVEFIAKGLICCFSGNSIYGRSARSLIITIPWCENISTGAPVPNILAICCRMSYCIIWITSGTKELDLVDKELDLVGFNWYSLIVGPWVVYYLYLMNSE